MRDEDGDGLLRLQLRYFEMSWVSKNYMMDAVLSSRNFVCEHKRRRRVCEEPECVAAEVMES